MSKLKEQFNKLAEMLNLKKENVFILIIALVLTRLSLNNEFVSILVIINALLLVFLLFMIMTVADFVVFKSLFLVSAEFSFLIFIAQSYCAIPNRQVAGDQALRTLLSFGILYIIYIFLDSFYETFKKSRESVKNESWTNEKRFVVVLYLVFVVIFLWNVIQVLNPIINNLCVYKK